MFVFFDLTRNVFLLKVKIIGSLLLAGCLDQLNFFHFLPIQPNFAFLTLYFWSFFFNHYLSFTFVFFFGMFIDLIGGSFLGENTLCFILLYGSIVFYQEHYSNDLSLEWRILWIAIIGLAIFQIILLSLIHHRLILSWGNLVENGFSLMFYPCLKYALQFLIKERRTP